MENEKNILSRTWRSFTGTDRKELYESLSEEQQKKYREIRRWTVVKVGAALATTAATAGIAGYLVGKEDSRGEESTLEEDGVASFLPEGYDENKIPSPQTNTPQTSVNESDIPQATDQGGFQSEHADQEATRKAEEEIFAGLNNFRREFPNYRELETVWGEDELKVAWQLAIESAAENEGKATLELPNGEILIGAKTVLDVPEGMKITIRSHREGSRIRGTREMADHPDNQWGANEHTLVEIGVNTGGKIILEDLFVHGGKEDKNYKAPRGPWNATIAIYGRGLGDKPDPNYGYEPRGMAEVRNSYFEKSEGPGVVVQNLKDFLVEGCTTRETDCLVTTNWCNSGLIRNCYGEECLSDFVFGALAKNITVKDSGGDLAWTGFNFRGCDNVLVENCQADRTFASYTTSDLEGTPTTNITFRDCDTDKASCPHAFQFVQGVEIIGGRHDRLGEVLHNQDFIDRLRNPEWIAREPVYIGPEVEGFVARDIHYRKSPNAPEDYQITTKPEGAEFYGFEE